MNRKTNTNWYFWSDFSNFPNDIYPCWPIGFWTFDNFNGFHLRNCNWVFLLKYCHGNHR